MVTRFLIVAPIALAVSAVFLGAATAPATAATVECSTMPGQLRAAAATATPDNARKALINVRTGEALCAADASHEGARKFSAAAKILGLDAAQLAASATPAVATN